MAGAVDVYLASGVILDGVQKPLASIARLLAESLEAAPLYSQAALAKQLRDLLSDLEQKSSWELERAERRAERIRGGSWLSDGET